MLSSWCHYINYLWVTQKLTRPWHRSLEALESKRILTKRTPIRYSTFQKKPTLALFFNLPSCCPHLGRTRSSATGFTENPAPCKIGSGPKACRLLCGFLLWAFCGFGFQKCQARRPWPRFPKGSLHSQELRVEFFSRKAGGGGVQVAPNSETKRPKHPRLCNVNSRLTSTPPWPQERNP